MKSTRLVLPNGKCEPRKPPYLDELRAEAKRLDIPNYSSMRKEELCEALGLIEKAKTPKAKPKRKVAKAKKKIQKPEITRLIDEYVKENLMTSYPVKENFKPPTGMADYYYLYFQRSGTPQRMYLLPPDFIVKKDEGLTLEEFRQKDQKFTQANNYLGNNTRNSFALFDVFETEGGGIWKGLKGLDAWLQPRAESRVNAYKTYTQATLRKAGREYHFP